MFAIVALYRGTEGNVGDIEYVVELAKAYERAEITREELQDKIHTCPLNDMMFGVNVFSEEYGDGATAAFVVEAGLRQTWASGCGLHDYSKR